MLVSIFCLSLVAISQTTPTIDTIKAVVTIDENHPGIVFTKTEIEAQFPVGVPA
jgi:hypothetical protein